MNYISTAATQSSLSAKFLCRTLPVSNSAPSAPPKRRPHKKVCTFRSPDLDYSIRTFTGSPFSSPTATPLFLSALTPGPATFPSDSPVPPADLDQGYALLLLAFVTQALATLRPGLCSLADTLDLSSFDRCRSAPQLCCLCLI